MTRNFISRLVCLIAPETKQAGRTAKTKTFRRPWLEELEVRVVPSVLSQFGGTAYTVTGSGGGVRAPDESIAVSATQIIEVSYHAGNLGVNVRSKSDASKVTSLEFDTVFADALGGLPSNRHYLDPYIVYDDNAGQFVVTITNFSQVSGAAFDHLLVAFSPDGATWHSVMIDAGESQAFLSDFPKIGFNNDAVVISSRQYPNTLFTHPEHLDHLLVTAIKATALFNFTGKGTLNPNVDYFLHDVLLPGNTTNPLNVGNVDNRDSFLFPAKMHGAPANGTMLFAETAPGVNGANDTALKQTMLVYSVANSTLLSPGQTLTPTKYSINVNPYFEAPLYLPGLVGSALKPEDIGSQVLSVDWRNNHLVAAHMVDLAGDHLLATARWYEFSADGMKASTPATLLDQGNLPGISSRHNTMYPSIALSPDGTDTLGMSYQDDSAVNVLGGYNRYVYMMAAVRPGGAGTAVQTYQVQYGDAQFNPSSSSPRLGDFSATVFDPSESQSFWAVNEFTSGTAGSVWSTEIAHFSGPPHWHPVGPGVLSSLAVGSYGSGNPEVFGIHGSSANNIYYHKLDASGKPTGSYSQLISPIPFSSFVIGHDQNNLPFFAGISGANDSTNGLVYYVIFDASGNPISCPVLAAPGRIVSLAIGNDASGNPELFGISTNRQAYYLPFTSNDNPLNTDWTGVPGHLTAISVGHDSANYPVLFGLYNTSIYYHLFNSDGSAKGGFSQIPGHLQTIAAGYDSHQGNPVLFGTYNNTVYYLRLNPDGGQTTHYIIQTLPGAFNSFVLGNAAPNGDPMVFGIDPVHGLVSHITLVFQPASGTATGTWQLPEQRAVSALAVGNYPSPSHLSKQPPEVFGISLWDQRAYYLQFDDAGNVI